MREGGRGASGWASVAWLGAWRFPLLVAGCAPGRASVAWLGAWRFRGGVFVAAFSRRGGAGGLPAGRVWPGWGRGAFPLLVAVTIFLGGVGG